MKKKNIYHVNGKKKERVYHFPYIPTIHYLAAGVARSIVKNVALEYDQNILDS